MKITLKIYPEANLAIYTCTGIFQFEEWMAVSEDYLDSQTTFQINDIRRIDFSRVTPDLLKAVVLTTKQHSSPDAPIRGKTAFIINQDFHNYDLFNTFMLWVHTLELNRDFALHFSTAKALEWFGLDPAVTPVNARGQSVLGQIPGDSQ